MMATNKIAMKFRSITYPTTESSGHKKDRRRLQRMESFDFGESPAAPPPPPPARAASGRREVSAEGRLRTHQFQHTHSTPNTLAPGQKMLRFSDECWDGGAGEQAGLRRQATSVGCLASPKAKPGAAVRLGANGDVERLVDWQRESPERRGGASPSGRERSLRSGRSKERREPPGGERRGHCSASASLPPQAKAEEAAPNPEARSRRSQFRRAWSLFSLTCDKEVERERREKSPQQRILRPPTRHFYRRGLSGLPIECSTRYLGLAY